MERLLALTNAERRRDLLLYLGTGQSSNDIPATLDLADVEAVRAAFGTSGSAGRIYSQAVDHFVRSRVEPFQAVLNNWMGRAKAQVDDRKIPFTEIITWCQDTSDNQARRTLTKEARTLCAFLAPFSQASWKVFLDVLEHDLGHPEYIAYCEGKRGISLTDSGFHARTFLGETRETYRNFIGPWLNTTTGLSLNKASRFDAIYLLGLRYLDHMFPRGITIEEILGFFRKWGMDLVENPAIHIHVEGKPGRQSYCIPINIPKDVHVIVGPLRGWLDMESLFHELGHALSFIYTDQALAPEEKDFFQSGALSEAFAFLLQKMCMSREFLQEILGLSSENAQIVSRAHMLKWLTLTRRYAAKLVIEVENFQLRKLKKGQALYSEVMRMETGFHYDPETYLFDLMPDFYSLDYFQAYIGAACLWDHLNKAVGERWVMNPETGSILRCWWHNGNRLDLTAFLQETLGRPLESGPFIKVNQYDLQS